MASCESDAKINHKCWCTTKPAVHGQHGQKTAMCVKLKMLHVDELQRLHKVKSIHKTVVAYAIKQMDKKSINEQFFAINAPFVPLDSINCEQKTKVHILKPFIGSREREREREGEREREASERERKRDRWREKGRKK